MSIKNSNYYRITEKETELKDIIQSAFEDIFVDGHELIKTVAGDITPSQNHLFEELQIKVYDLLIEQIEQNLPK